MMKSVSHAHVYGRLFDFALWDAVMVEVIPM